MRRAPADAVIDVLVLHYTELPLKESLDILCDGAREHRVSAHYVLAEDGTLYRLVPEDRVAWHAGRSHWRGREALNATSIGVEIVNLHGDRHDYPETQIAALIELCHGILARHPAIVPRNVVGHSDIAPKRKIDPGLRFPWATLARVRHRAVAAARRRSRSRATCRRRSSASAIRLPSGVTTADIVASFQRRFRPSRVDGIADPETRALLADLLDQVGRGA